MQQKNHTQHQWGDKIEAIAPFTAGLKLKRKTDYSYLEIVGGQKVWNDPDAYIFSNSSDHDDIVLRAATQLEQKAGSAFVAHLLGELTYRKTYGAFSEMAAYDWMDQSGISFVPQVGLGASDVVNPNGSTLDGKLRAADKDIYFDIKGFGFIEHKIAILKNRLEQKAAGDEVIIEGVFSVSIDEIQTLLERSGFEPLMNELEHSSSAQRGTLKFRRRPRPTVSISMAELDPVELAIENRTYALRFGSQFSRNAPFMLFFVIHPWFTKGSLHQNLGTYTDRFCLEFARQSFLSFQNDGELREGMPTMDLVKLLSAVAFINVWPQNSTKGAGPSSRIYLNPGATHTIAVSDLADLKAQLGNDVSIIEV